MMPDCLKCLHVSRNGTIFHNKEFKKLFNQCVVAVERAYRRTFVITDTRNIAILRKGVPVCIISVLIDMCFNNKEISPVFAKINDVFCIKRKFV